jgi:uncharacterized protein YcfL
MKRYVIVLLSALLVGCHCKKEIQRADCSTKETVIQTTNELIKKQGIDTTTLKVQVLEDDKKFKVLYSLKDTLSIGFSAEILINKADCRVVSMKLYQ